MLWIKNYFTGSPSIKHYKQRKTERSNQGETNRSEHLKQFGIENGKIGSLLYRETRFKKIIFFISKLFIFGLEIDNFVH